MPIVAKVDMPAWLRQVMQTREVYGVLIGKGYSGPAYNEHYEWGAPTNQQLSGFAWNTLNYSGAQIINIAANPQRKVLIIENLTTTPVAVSFGTTAKYNANAAQVLGNVLTTLGSVFYIDRNCPTNSFYIDMNGSAVAVTQAVPGP